MKLYEYQAKEILRQYLIPTPQGLVATDAGSAALCAKKIGFPCVIKAQVHAGGRGKAGGVKVVQNEQEARNEAARILELTIKDLRVKTLLIEPAIDIAKEYYLGIIFDRHERTNVLIFSTMGGMDIEKVAEEDPKALIKIKIDLTGKTIPVVQDVPEQIVKALIELYRKTDATLVEINPLARTSKGEFIACDAKMIIDDNALYRQPNMLKYADLAEDPIEAEAHKQDIAYVRLPGDIGIVGNGAGLVMCTMDEVKRAGGRPASFLDLGGGSKADKVKKCLELLLKDKNIKGIFINVFGGITRCDEVAKGLIQVKAELNITMPIVIRLTGTSEKEGRELLKTAGLISVVSMQEGAKKITELTQ